VDRDRLESSGSLPRNSGGASHPSKPKPGARRGPRDPSPARKQFNQESCMVMCGFRVLSSEGKGSQSTVGLLAKFGDQTGLFPDKSRRLQRIRIHGLSSVWSPVFHIGKGNIHGRAGRPTLHPPFPMPLQISSHCSRRQKETKGGLGPPSSMA